MLKIAFELFFLNYQLVITHGDPVTKFFMPILLIGQ
jgi:hypothetical protein